MGKLIFQAGFNGETTENKYLTIFINTVNQPMSAIQIIGIILVRNEDIFIKNVINNISQFCDRIIVTDHQSNDKTPEIIKKLAKKNKKINYLRIQHPKESHTVIEKYAGTNTWIFAVDGDEIYDPEGLHKFKKKLIEGTFNNYWQIKGNVLNCTSINHKDKIAKGYLSPPARSMTKLYNFSIIEKWNNCPQRIHAGDLEFKKNIKNTPTLELFKHIEWDDAHFRCLHTVFMQRSSKEKRIITTTRLNPAEKMSAEQARESNNHIKYLRKNLKSYFRLDWKNKKYKKGKLTTKNIATFL
ncbi:glycosyltransferase [Prosthecochloris sp. SCSIO W1103]|uniref:glycosyltransferase n=1 Tax=Prosthecochloris sp. SCSIO W1103 TaxID=2992244 RepID=UPI00223D70DB|nr:glycosyltransferase [Prosthecochloris sp. SCSIO W1103]UZJ37313.1 glycosyltransferase family 2 protein [Prosthecochloris sp. SCSIO W1103]